MARGGAFPVLGLVGLVVFVTGAVAVGRGADRVAQVQIERPADAVRDFVFVDTPEGSVLVRDADSGNAVASLAAGSSGFLRATLRGLARERRNAEHDSQTPFRVAAWREGRVTLTDLATGASVELLAFGSTNAATFAALLDK